MWPAFEVSSGFSSLSRIDLCCVSLCFSSSFLLLLMKQIYRVINWPLILKEIHFHICHVNRPTANRRAIQIRKCFCGFFFFTWWIGRVWEEDHKGRGNEKEKKGADEIGWQQQFVVDMGTSSPPPRSIHKKAMWTFLFLHSFTDALKEETEKEEAVWIAENFLFFFAFVGILSAVLFNI